MKVIIASLLLAAITCTAYGQNTNGHKPFILGVTDSFQSTQLSENRKLNIYLPDAYYKDTTASFPVIYLLDGSADEDFIHITGLVQFLTMIEAMPPSVIIGVANVDRRRDFTFPTTVKKDKEDYPTTGSSAKFISFVEKDLQPYVEQHYRVGKSKTIIGQSLGGLVATEILLRKPALFNNYIIVSPSLWWNNESLLADAPALLKQNKVADSTKIYIAVGNEGKQMEGDAKKLSELLKQTGNSKLKVLFYPFPQEDHLTILHNSVYKAFEVLNKK